ncbi:MAG: hypothetical protein C0483_14145 [Pirellula sp.]|nr:hypothetical protein [Pirellula sp.]
MTSNPDFDRPLTADEADKIVRMMSDGKMHVKVFGEQIILCSSDRDEGHRLFTYELTRRGLMRAVVEYFPELPKER